MTSQLKIEANRANGKKGTGPRSTSLTRLNALKFGTHATVNLLPGEDANALDQLEQEVFQICSPIGPIEVVVTQHIVSCAWRLKRLAKAEHAALKRVEIETLLEDEGVSKDSYSSSGNKIDLDLKHQLAREELHQSGLVADARTLTLHANARSNGATASKSDRALPISLIFLRIYGFGKSGLHVTEIDRKASAVMKEMLHFQERLEAIQERRKTFGVSVTELKQMCLRSTS